MKELILDRAAILIEGLHQQPVSRRRAGLGFAGDLNKPF